MDTSQNERKIMNINPKKIEWTGYIVVKVLLRRRAYVGRWCIGRIQEVDDDKWVAKYYLPGISGREIKRQSEQGAMVELEERVGQWLEKLEEEPRFKEMGMPTK